jgi:DNA-binding response OmpR family regulator
VAIQPEGDPVSDQHSPGAGGPPGERRQMGRKHVFVVNGSPEFLDVVRELL